MCEYFRLNLCHDIEYEFFEFHIGRIARKYKIPAAEIIIAHVCLYVDADGVIYSFYYFYWKIYEKF